MSANPVDPARGSPTFETCAEDAAAAYVGPHAVVRPALPSDASPPAKVVLNIPDGAAAGEGDVLALRARRRTATVRIERRELEARQLDLRPAPHGIESGAGEATSLRPEGRKRRTGGLVALIVAVLAGASGLGAWLLATPSPTPAEASLAPPPASPPEPSAAEAPAIPSSSPAAPAPEIAEAEAAPTEGSASAAAPPPPPAPLAAAPSPRPAPGEPKWKAPQRSGSPAARPAKPRPASAPASPKPAPSTKHNPAEI